VQWTTYIYNISLCMACITEIIVFPSYFSWCQRRIRWPTRGKRYKKNKYDLWPSMRYPLRRSVNLLMKYGQILYFVFNRKHALNTIIYSVLRSLWSGISCYSSNRCRFFIPSHFPFVNFSALSLSDILTKPR